MGHSFVETCRLCFQLLRDVPLRWHFLFTFSTLVGIFLLVLTLLIVFAPRPRPTRASEKKFKTLLQDGRVTDLQPLPCWLDRNLESKMSFESEKSIEPAELYMSVVIPAFNEESRLTGMLEEAVNYLENEYGRLGENDTEGGSKPQEPLRRRADGQLNGAINEKATEYLPRTPSRGWEVVVVDDGSSDATVETALNFARTHQFPLRPRRISGPWTHRAEHTVNIPAGSIRIVSLVKNRGKGGAVTHGMKHVRGRYVIFADADGASRFDDLGKLLQACQRAEDSQGRAIAVGSRAHLVGSEAVVKRSKLRNFLMHSFHLLLKCMTPSKTAAIRDTQCGFKLFSRPSLPYIIPYMHCEGWIFDVEMLMLAEFANIPVVEVPVGWREVLGSKLNVIWDSMGMAYGLAVLRLCWGLGIYRRH